MPIEATRTDRGHGANLRKRISWNQAARCASETWLPTRVITRPRRSRHLPKRPRIAPTSPSRDSQLARHASGPTSHRNNATRSMPTVDGLAADVVSDSNDCASERVERSFAHVCETGGARRTWIGGIAEVGKRYVIKRHGPQLGTPDHRKLFGMGTPRGLQKAAEALTGAFVRYATCLIAVERVLRLSRSPNSKFRRRPAKFRSSAASLTQASGEIIEIRVFQRAASEYIFPCLMSLLASSTLSGVIRLAAPR